MTLTIDQLTAEAMRLPMASRAELAEQLVESLDLSADFEIHKVWAVEALRRRDDVRAGLVQTIPTAAGSLAIGATECQAGVPNE